MPWKAMRLRGQRVLARCDDAGTLRAEGDGRVEIRYGPKNPKSYRAAARNLEPDGDASIHADGYCADLAGPADAPSETPVKKNRTASAEDEKRFVSVQLSPSGQATISLPGLAPHIVAYADGACSGNPGPCGAGALIEDGTSRFELSEYLGRGTNNIAELTALLRVAEALAGEARPITIRTDSQYAIGVLTKGWKAKANPELIGRVKVALGRLPSFTLGYVRGHAGDPRNERADALARLAVEEKSSTGWTRPDGASDR